MAMTTKEITNQSIRFIEKFVADTNRKEAARELLTLLENVTTWQTEIFNQEMQKIVEESVIKIIGRLN
jgi:hypothetical protein